MKTVKIGDPTLRVAGLASAEEEGRYLAALIEQRLGGFSFQTSGSAGTRSVVSLADFAVLYRLHAQGEIIGRVFDERGVPYKKLRKGAGTIALKFGSYLSD